MKKQGANNGACLAFLISTPESGVDSIAITYSLLDLPLTIIRPVTAFLSGFLAGAIENFKRKPLSDAALKNQAATSVSSEKSSPGDLPRANVLFFTKLRTGFDYAFGELLGDIAIWFIIGILIAGIIEAFVPEDFISGELGTGFVAYLAVLFFSLPMYVCATMSTPIAAALILKGLSPGAALVLLIAGPATNAATITMVWGLLGRKSLFIYLGSIIFVALIAAFATDYVYSFFNLPLPNKVSTATTSEIPFYIELIASIVLGIFIIRNYLDRILQSHLIRKLRSPSVTTKKMDEVCNKARCPEG